MNMLEKMHATVTDLQRKQKGDESRGRNLSPYRHEEQLFRTMNDFDELVQIGEGTFASCFKARDKRTNKTVVVKRIPFKTVPEVKLIATELGIIRKLRHPNIVGLWKFFFWESKDFL